MKLGQEPETAPATAPDRITLGGVGQVLAEGQVGGQVRGAGTGPALLRDDAPPVADAVRRDRGAGAGLANGAHVLRPGDGHCAGYAVDGDGLAMGPR